MSAFSYGWGQTNDPSEEFWVKFAPCTRKPESWKEEVYAAARAIANKTTKPIWLCLSGGIDGEVMARGFFDQGIHFSVLTLEHVGGTNQHDIVYAKKWCAARGIVQTVVPIDMHVFMTRDVPGYVRDGFITNNIFRYLQIKLLETVEARGGYAVLGGGEQYYTVDDSDAAHVPMLVFDVGYAAPLEWCRRNAASHEPYFYFSSPEITRAYMDLPLVETALRDGRTFINKTNVYLLKRIAYHTVFPDLEARYKYNGFEKVLEERTRVEAELYARFGPLLKKCSITIPELMTQLGRGEAMRA